MISTTKRPLDTVLDALRTLRRLPERLLHPLRRRLAKKRLERTGDPMTVLVVCYGNICRSPYAAARVRALLPTVTSVRVESAGFAGPHRESPPDAVAVAGVRGIDLRRHRSRLLTAATVRGADLVLVMEPRQRTALHSQFGRTKHPVLVLGDLDPDRPKTRAIRDPVDQPRAVFVDCYARIDRCLSLMVRSAWPHPGPDVRSGAVARAERG